MKAMRERYVRIDRRRPRGRAVRTDLVHAEGKEEDANLERRAILSIMVHACGFVLRKRPHTTLLMNLYFLFL